MFPPTFVLLADESPFAVESVIGHVLIWREQGIRYKANEKTGCLGALHVFRFRKRLSHVLLECTTSGARKSTT